MHNLKTNFDKMLDICKQTGKAFTNAQGNTLSIDSEKLLFSKPDSDYKSDFSNLISRRQYNDRRKYLFGLTDSIRKGMVESIDATENVFSVIFHAVTVTKLVRQIIRKLLPRAFVLLKVLLWIQTSAVCGIRGVIHSFDLTKVAVLDIHYLNDLKCEISDCTLLGNKAYISKEVRLDLFETAHISLEVPYRINSKDFKPAFGPFKRFRKRIETLFSQPDDRFLMIGNYVKDVDGIFTRGVG
jgi:hypothetical protein